MVNGFAPTSFNEALAIRNSKSVIPYAGGTDLMVGMSEDKSILFLNNIDSLKKVWQDQDSIYIGSCCSFKQLLGEELVPEVLKKAISEIASPAIRNLGTIGGNICNGSPAGDTLPVLYALNSMLVLRTVAEKSVIAIEEFISGPKRTKLKDNQLLQYIIIPKQNCNNYYYKKIGSRKAESISKISFTGIVKVEGNRIRRLSIAFGSVGPTVVRERILEEKLTGLTLCEAEKMKGNIIEAYKKIINPINDQRSTAEYRKKVAINLLDDFLSSIK